MTHSEHVRPLASSIGLKAVMALSGLGMVGWLVLHMAGNLLVFSGAEALNGYGALLRTEPALLWAVRLGLLAAIAVHVQSAVRLSRRNWAARAGGYRAPRRARGRQGRSMAWSGAALLLLGIAHVLHIYGPLHADFVEGDVFHNLVAGVRAPVVWGLYAVGVALMGIHLQHGVWSALRSLGLYGASGLDRWLDRGAVGLTAVLVVGFWLPLLAIAVGIL